MRADITVNPEPVNPPATESHRLTESVHTSKVRTPDAVSDTVAPDLGTPPPADTANDGSNYTECFGINCGDPGPSGLSTGGHILGGIIGYSMVLLPLWIMLFVYRKPLRYYITNFVRVHMYGKLPLDRDDSTQSFTRKPGSLEYDRWFGSGEYERNYEPESDGVSPVERETIFYDETPPTRKPGNGKKTRRFFF